MKRALALLLAVAACSNEHHDPPLPVMVDQGGPKMAHPQLVSIFYDDDADVTTLSNFAEWIVKSSWLTAVGAEYGVGSGSVLGNIQLTTPAPDDITEDQLVSLIYDGIDAKTLPSPPDGNFLDTLYILYLPAHTTVHGSGQTSCKEYLGFHNSARRGGRELAYAVIASCPGAIANLNALEARQDTASHEIIEAATDPVPGNNPGFQVTDPSTGWSVLGNEVADLCARGDDSREWHESGFVAQRSWSKAAALKGEPCVPVPGTSGAFFYLDISPGGVRRAAPGAKLTYSLTARATGSLARPGTVSQLNELNLLAVSFTDAQPTLKLGTGSLGIGSTTTLDVTIPSDSQAGDEIEVAVVSRIPTDYQLQPLRIGVGAACSASTDCVSCGNQDGCGWCAKSSRCEAVGPDGSAESSCRGDDFAGAPGQCPGFCAAHSGSCGDCASQFGCGYCGGATPQCLALSGTSWNPKGASCPYADWDVTPDYCQ